MKKMANFSIEQEIAMELALLNDGQLNDWQNYLPDSVRIVDFFKKNIKPLLEQGSETTLREGLATLFSLTSLASIPKNDSQPAVCSPTFRVVPKQRRRVRRRSFKSTSFR